MQFWQTDNAAVYFPKAAYVKDKKQKGIDKIFFGVDK